MNKLAKQVVVKGCVQDCQMTTRIISWVTISHGDLQKFGNSEFLQKYDYCSSLDAISNHFVDVNKMVGGMKMRWLCGI